MWPKTEVCLAMGGDFSKACDCSSEREGRVAVQRRDSKAHHLELEPATYDHPLLNAAAEYNLNRLIFLLVSDPAAIKFARDSCHNTVMHIAAKHGSFEVFLHLLDREADLIFVLNKFLNSVAHTAAEHGQVEILQVISARYPHLLSAKNTLGASPAHLAAGRGQLAALQFLVDLDGVALHYLDARGFSVADHAVRDKRSDVIDWIRDTHPSALQPPPRGASGVSAKKRGLAAHQKAQDAAQDSETPAK